MTLLEPLPTTGIRRYLPDLASIAHGARHSVEPDSRAALTVWAVVVPQSLAYATLAGVPSVHGLYAAVGALAAYAVFGTCRDLNMGADERRSAVEVIVDFDTDLGRAGDVIRRPLAEVAGVNRLGSIRSRVVASGIELSIRLWHAPGIQAGNAARDAAIPAILAALADADIGIAPPARMRTCRIWLAGHGNTRAVWPRRQIRSASSAVTGRTKVPRGRGNLAQDRGPASEADPFRTFRA